MVDTQSAPAPPLREEKEEERSLQPEQEVGRPLNDDKGFIEGELVKG